MQIYNLITSYRMSARIKIVLSIKKRLPWKIIQIEVMHEKFHALENYQN